jgi:lipid II isoglutaminyl synthase (glutamine-hydrolysing)
VSGTNGKTTTTHFLAAAIRASLGRSGDRLVHNADGANLHAGIASALSVRPDADIAILDTDERVVADLIKLGRPEVLVLLNFSRDQLDRHHEIKALGRSWRNALAEAGGADGPTGGLGRHSDHLDPRRVAVPAMRCATRP